jgi:hypothetical protein
MTVVTYPEIDALRSQFEGQEGSDLAFDILEEHEGNLDKAIEDLADKEGINIWSLNEQCRSFICQKAVRRTLPGLADVVTTFLAQFYLPGLFAAALGVLIAVKVESDLEIYCDF